MLPWQELLLCTIEIYLNRVLKIKSLKYGEAYMLSSLSQNKCVTYFIFITILSN